MWVTASAVLLVVLLGSAGLAGEAAQPDLGVYTLKYRPAEDVAAALRDVIQDGKYRVKVAGPHVLYVVVSPPDKRLVDELVARLDVPDVAFQVRARLILAASDYKELQPVPKELQDLAGLLSSVFTFKKYDLLDEVVLAAKAGSPTTMVLAGGEYELRFTARHEPTGGQQPAAAGLFAFDTFVLGKRDVVRVEEEKRGGTTVRKEIMGYKPVLATSFRAEAEKPVVVGASRTGDSGKALIIVLTVSRTGT
jgi:hypothetical protein